MLQHHREGVVEQGFALALRFLLHRRALHGGVGVKAGGEEQAAAVEGLAVLRGVEPAGNLVREGNAGVAGKAVGEDVAHQVAVEGERLAFKGADDVIKLHGQGVEVAGVLALEDRAANFPGADEIPLFVLHDVLVQV